MINVYNNPTLLDFLKVAWLMPQDERDNLEAMVGEPFDVDGVAVGNFTVAGPKWVIKRGDDPIVVGGFAFQRKGVWRDFLLTTPAAWEAENWFTTTRVCRRAMDKMFSSGEAHRLECITLAARVKNRPELKRWYKMLGYTKEGVLRKYCASGADAMVFSRVGR